MNGGNLNLDDNDDNGSSPRFTKDIAVCNLTCLAQVQNLLRRMTLVVPEQELEGNIFHTVIHTRAEIVPDNSIWSATMIPAFPVFSDQFWKRPVIHRGNSGRSNTEAPRTFGRQEEVRLLHLANFSLLWAIE